MRDAAAENARLFGYEGWRYLNYAIARLFLVLTNKFLLTRFPWESARTGVDVTPDCCPEVRLYQMHITGDIAFATRQYVAAIGNRHWLLNEFDDELIYEIAEFWSSRVVYNSEKNKHEILDKVSAYFQ